MTNMSMGQVILDAQRVASRVKDLDALGSALLVEAEGNNRLVESLRQFQDDMESLNRISNNKTNADIINRIQQQNAHSAEILKENRELKICLEDYEYAMELIMQKYRDHMNNKVLESKLNFREVYNDKLWKIIRQQREKINEMAAVMQRVAAIDDDAIFRELETMSRLRLENKTLRELLLISKQAGSAFVPLRLNDHLLVEKGVQTETDDSSDELSLSATSVENANNNTVIQNDNSAASKTVNNNNNNNNTTTTCQVTAAAAAANVVVGDVAEPPAEPASNENNNAAEQAPSAKSNSVNVLETTTNTTTAAVAVKATLPLVVSANASINANDQALVNSAT